MWQFTEQFKRMERWHERMKVIYKKVPKDMGDLADEDDVLAFFQNCYHLKDWIKNYTNSGLSASEVKNFVHASEILKLCGGLCNGSKHLKIDDPSFDKNIRINRHFYLPRGGHIIGRSFVITSKGNEYDALELANKCVDEWKDFFKNK